MKILGLKFGKKSVDDVVSNLALMIGELDIVANEKANEAREHREKAIKETELADAAAGESGRARTVLGKIRDLISGEQPDTPTPMSWPPQAG